MVYLVLYSLHREGQQWEQKRDVCVLKWDFISWISFSERLHWIRSVPLLWIQMRRAPCSSHLYSGLLDLYMILIIELNKKKYIDGGTEKHELDVG